MLERLSIDKEYLVRQSVAENIKTPVTILEQLVRNETDNISATVVKNPQCNFQIKEIIFKSLAKSQQPSLSRLAVFLSEYAESEDLVANYNSTSWLERYAIAQNSQTPDDTLKLLAKDCNRIVRATAKESLKKRQSLLNK